MCPLVHQITPVLHVVLLYFHEFYAENRSLCSFCCLNIIHQSCLLLNDIQHRRKAPPKPNLAFPPSCNFSTQFLRLPLPMVQELRNRPDTLPNQKSVFSVLQTKVGSAPPLCLGCKPKMRWFPWQRSDVYEYLCYFLNIVLTACAHGEDTTFIWKANYSQCTMAYYYHTYERLLSAFR